MRTVACGCMIGLLVNTGAYSQKTAGSFFYEIRIYHLENQSQTDRVDHFLEHAYLPALHRRGIKTVGVFKPAEEDSTEQRIYIFIPFQSYSQYQETEQSLEEDKQFMTRGSDYLQAVYTDVPYKRIETIFLKSMPGTGFSIPHLKGPGSERIYELRSYEGPTEKYFASKIKMFTKGGETVIFNRLNFNPVFYGSVMAGSRMPNLMYMTTFENKSDREAHWKAFSADPDWKKLSAMPEYKNNVSKINIVFLHPVPYSDF